MSKILQFPTTSAPDIYTQSSLLVRDLDRLTSFNRTSPYPPVNQLNRIINLRTNLNIPGLRDSVADRISFEKNNQIHCPDEEDLHTVNAEHFQLLEEVKGEKELVNIRNWLRDKLDRILTDPFYAETIEAYQLQNTEPAALRLLNSRLPHLGYLGLLLPGGSQDLLHGLPICAEDFLTMSEKQLKEHFNPLIDLATPQSLAAKISKINEFGLKAEPSPANLPKLESSIVSTRIKCTHGLAVLKFPFASAKTQLWQRSRSPISGLQIVSPVHHPPFEVLLKDRTFFDSKSFNKDETQDAFRIISERFYAQYMRELKKTLKEAAIPYAMVETEGRTYQDITPRKK